MNITVEARHMEITDAIREYAQKKAEKFSTYFDGVQTAEIILDIEAGKPTVEIVVQASRKSTFVAHHRDENMYAAVDQCASKLSEQLRRHKDKLRDH